MNERLGGVPHENVPRQPNHEFTALYDTEIDLADMDAVIRKGGLIEFEVLGGNIDGLSEKELRERVDLAKELLPVLRKFYEAREELYVDGKEVLDDKLSNIKSQIDTFTTFIKPYEKLQ